MEVKKGDGPVLKIGAHPVLEVPSLPHIEDRPLLVFEKVDARSIRLKENILLVHADSHFDLIAGHSDLRVESLVSLVNTR